MHFMLAARLSRMSSSRRTLDSPLPGPRWQSRQRERLDTVAMNTALIDASIEGCGGDTYLLPKTRLCKDGVEAEKSSTMLQIAPT